jgi:hypothetical protein
MMRRIGGRLRNRPFGGGGANLEIPLFLRLPPNPTTCRGQRLVGSLTGAVASQKVTEASKGSLRVDGNHPWSVLV